MSNSKTVVNGFEIPNGRYSLAVRHVVDLLLEKPGLSSAELLHSVMKKARVTNAAKSLFVPGDNSPVDRLWERKKAKKANGKHVYKYFLRPGAEVLAGSFEEEQEKVFEQIKKQLYTAHGLRVFDLAEVYIKNNQYKIGLIIDVWAGLSVLVLLDGIPTIVHFDRLRAV